MLTKERKVRLDGNLNAWGMILGWIDPNDNTPMWEQIDRNYAHGGGWNDFDGFRVVAGDKDTPYVIQYPGDPVHTEVSRIMLDDEILVIFNYSWVLWSDGTDTKIARID